jgi:hypothetical protein
VVRRCAPTSHQPFSFSLLRPDVRTRDGAGGADPFAAAEDDGEGDGGGAGGAEALFAPPVPSRLVLATPPLEEQLIQGTLWAEVDKLYGSGAVVSVCACVCKCLCMGLSGGADAGTGIRPS